MKAWVYVTLCILILSGCSTPSKQQVQHDFGVLGVVVASNSVINVNAPTWLWDNRLRYRLLYSESTQIRYYGLDHWLAPPPELLERYLRQYCQVAPFNLAIELLEFEQQFSSLRQASVVLSFTATALRAQQVIGAKTFRLVIATPSADASGAVTGFVSLARQAVTQLQSWLGILAVTNDSH